MRDARCAFKQLLSIAPPITRDSTHELALVTQVQIYLNDIAQQLLRVELVFLRVLHFKVRALGSDQRIEIVIKHRSESVNNLRHHEWSLRLASENLEQRDSRVAELGVARRVSLKPTQRLLALAAVLQWLRGKLRILHLSLDLVDSCHFAQRFVHEICHVIYHQVDKPDESLHIVSVPIVSCG